MSAVSSANLSEGAQASELPAQRDDLDERVAGLRERIGHSKESETNILVRICSTLSQAISWLVNKVKQLWRAIVGPTSPLTGLGYRAPRG